MEQKPATLNTVIIACAITCVIFGGMLFTLREQLREEYETAIVAQQDTIEKLEKKVSTLESQTAELMGRPAPDTAIVDGLRDELSTAKSTIDTLTQRITQLESKPAEPAPAPVVVTEKPTPETVAGNGSYTALKAAVASGNVYEAELDIWEKEHPKAGLKIPALRANADTGLPTEDKLRGQLRNLLTRADAKESFPDNSLAARMNKHLSGLISIKKSTDVAPATKLLKDSVDTASIETLKARVDALPDTQKSAYADWLHDVEARSAALAELATLDAAP